jgi:hypothetical protein
MIKAIRNTLAASFAFCAITGAAHAGECRSETSREIDVTELADRLPAHRALGMIILFEPGSDLLKQISAALPDQYGEILNNVSGDTVKFDPHSARKLNDKTFNEMPIILVHGCLQKRSKLAEALSDLQKIPGIKAVTFDVKLYEPLETPLPVQPETPAGP